jgi:hypothetical protein
MPAPVPQVIPQFPHCEATILHPPGTCDVCDQHPDWQQLRNLWGINFTGENDEHKIPCPSTRRRPLAAVHAWVNNRPRRGDQGEPEEEPAGPQGPSVYERLREPFGR